ncbi:MAG: DUF72 domain-containing protein [Thermoguttaceae bacterium]|jgi:uncharacterized protein YecE (DUF72 family)|nr:DUF72 domain-containing protein [Thermoguttaceae bacterium]
MPKRTGPAPIHVGTSGWTYPDWAGVFYPTDVRGADQLAFYATRFDAVEVNSTFYRFPNEATIASWNRRLLASFHFVVKGSRRVTHLGRPGENREVAEAFCQRVAALRTLRAILWQFPPGFEKDLKQLTEFLKYLPEDRRHAVEFRHASWWDEQTAALLTRSKVAFVAVSHPKLPDVVFPTADLLYVRFHGLGKELYRYDYSDRQLDQWADRLCPHLAGRTLYAFFNNTYQAKAVANATAFRTLLAEKVPRKGCAGPEMLE